MHVDHDAADIEAVEERHKTPNWWGRNWLKVCLGALFAWTTLGFALGVNERSDRIDELTHEGNARTAQFCQVLLGQHSEKGKRIEQTEMFLETPAGEEHTPLNDYIRAVSLPLSKRELAQEAKTLPPVCLARKEKQDAETTD